MSITGSFRETRIVVVCWPQIRRSNFRAWQAERSSGSEGLMKEGMKISYRLRDPGTAQSVRITRMILALVIELVITLVEEGT
jgi:hypothetical protein